MKATLTSVMLLAACSLALSQSAPSQPESSVFLDALKRGRATDPLPDTPQFHSVILQLQRKSGDSGPIFITASVVKRFVQQPNCGRIEFHLSQPSTNRNWPNTGGQLNICTNGAPPLKVCPSGRTKLVRHDTVCAFGRPPVDTEEVADAIHQAVAAGGMTPEALAEKSTMPSRKASK